MPQEPSIERGLGMSAELASIRHRFKEAKINFVFVISQYLPKSAHFSTCLSVHDRPDVGVTPNHGVLDTVREILSEANQMPDKFGGNFILPWVSDTGEPEPPDRVALRELYERVMNWSEDAHE